MCSMSPSWSTVSRVGSMPSPSRSIHASRLRDCIWNSTVRLPTQASGTGMWSTRMVPDGSRKSGSAPAGRIRRRIWSAVHFTVATGVVDAGDDLLETEGLPRDARRDDVGVVTARDRGEGVGAADAGLLQHLLVEAVARDLVAVELRAEAPERIRLAVDDGHGVVAVLEATGKRRTDAATTHDHDVHARTVSQRGYRQLRV